MNILLHKHIIVGKIFKILLKINFHQRIDTPFFFFLLIYIIVQEHLEVLLKNIIKFITIIYQIIFARI